MTQFSWNFSCSPDTGDAGPLTAENLAAARLFMGNINPQGAGIVFWNDDTQANILFPGTPPGLSTAALDDLLQVVDAGGGVVEVLPGIGFVLGRLFVNDSNEQFDINSDPGEADATDLIVLRRNNLASVEQSVRLERKKATTPSSTAVVQQDGTIWEVALAEILLDGSGELSAITNVGQLITPPGTLVKIAEVVGDGAISTVDFNNIPALFSALRLIGKCRTSAATSDVAIRLRFNGDTGANYEFVNLVVDSSPAATPGANLTADHMQIGSAPGTTSPSDHAGEFDVQLLGYADGFYKSCLINNKYINSGSARFMYLGSAAWRDVDPVTDLEISFGGAGGNFVAGSKIVLYGIV